MIWLTFLINKVAVVLSDARSLGTITNFGWNKQSNCAVAQTQTGQFRLLRLFTVNDAVTVEQCETVGIDCPLLGSAVYDTTGVFLSEVKDVLVDKYCIVKKILTADGRLLPASKIYKIGDAVLIKSALPKCPKKPYEKSGGNSDISAQHETDSGDLPAAPLHGIERRYGDFSFLLGRTCNKTITDFRGEVMVRKGALISRETLRQAKISGKLIELTLNS